LNLATRPAGNERLPGLLLTVGSVLLLGATVAHGLYARRLASAAVTSLDAEVVRLEQEQQELRVRERSLRGVRTNPAALARWRVLKGLVDQRAFSWTTLLASLEATVPPDVRILSISPDVGKGRFRLVLEAVTREGEDAVALVKALEDRPEFEEVFLRRLDEDREGMRSSYEMTYRAPAGETPVPKEAVARASSAEPGP
jgi:Tfp pilus assembly protein PilN